MDSSSGKLRRAQTNHCTDANLVTVIQKEPVRGGCVYTIMYAAFFYALNNVLAIYWDPCQCSFGSLNVFYMCFSTLVSCDTT